MLGAWRKIPLLAISEPTVPMATAGFTVAMASGMCLLATKATEYTGNPFLYLKFLAIALGILNVFALNFLPGWKAKETRDLSLREQSQLALAGGISLFCWLMAITCGRMIGYW